MISALVPMESFLGLPRTPQVAAAAGLAV